MSNYTKENLIQIPPTAVPAGTLAMKVGDEIFTPGNIRISAGGMDFYKCASVDTTSKTWTGYLAVLTDGVYTFEETATTGLTYGTAFVPAQGKIYNTDATVAVSGLYEGRDPNLVFHALLTGRSAVAETGQTMAEAGTVQYTTFGGRECAYFDGSSALNIADITGFPSGSQLHTVAGFIAFDGIYTNYIMGYGDECAFSAYVDNVAIVNNTSHGGALTHPISDGTFYHFALTWDGVLARLYVNGTEADTNSTVPNFNLAKYASLRIGGSPRVGYGKGYISDVRIYNRCLTAEEIAELANN